MVLQELAAEKKKKTQAELLRQKWKQRVEKLGVHLKLRMLFHYFTSTCIEWPWTRKKEIQTKNEDKGTKNDRKNG